MATVVRIKRRSEDEPLEALILNCKRQKLSDSSNDVVLQNPELSSTVLTLAGTIEEVSCMISIYVILFTFTFRTKTY